MADISQLNINIRASANTAANAIAKLRGELQALRGAISGNTAKNLSAVASSLAKISAATSGTSSGIVKMGNSVQKIATQAPTAATALTALNTVFQNTGNILSTAAPTAQSFAAAMKQLAQSYGSITSTASAAATSSNKAATAQKNVAKATSQAATSARRSDSGFKKLGETIGKMLSPLTRLAQRFKRTFINMALRSAIRGISSAVKEGLTNLQGYSETVGTAYAKTVNTLKQHTLLLKNSFATALRPVIEAIIPVIIQLCDWLSRAADFMAQVMSVLTGKVDDNGRYTKAVLGDLEESTEQAKELKRTLLGFDEINRLEGDSGNGSSGNRGLDFVQDDVSEEAQGVAAKIQEIVAKIREFINTTDWETVAGLLGLASLVFGMLTGNLPAIAAGFALVAANADKVYAALESGREAANTFFEDLSSGVNTGNEDLDEMLRGIIGTCQTIVNEGFNILEEGVAWVTDTVETAGSIARKIAEGDWKGAGKEFLAYLKRTWNHAVSIVTSVGKILDSLVQGIIINPIQTGLKMAKKSIENALNKVIQKLRSNGTTIGKIIGNYLTFVKDLSNGIFDILGMLFDWIGETFSAVIKIITQLLQGDFKGAASTLIEWLIMSIQTLLNIIISAANVIISLVMNVIVNPIGHAVEWLWNKVIVPVINWIAQGCYDIARKVTEILETIANAVQDTLKWVWNNIIVAFINKIKHGFVDAVNKIIEWSNEHLGTDFKKLEMEDMIEWNPDKFDFALPEQTIEIVGEFEWQDLTVEIPKVDLSGFNRQVQDALGLTNREAEKTLAAVKKVSDNIATVARQTANLTGSSAIGRLTGGPSASLYASGGFPSAGSLFIAGEAGPELVANIGSQTGVWNSDQLIQGMYNAFAAALAANPQGGGDIYLDGEVIYKNTVRRNNNRVRSTGRSALLT